MCLHPILIKNPNLGKKNLSFLKDTTSTFIPIPCGYCPECIALRQMYLVQRVQMESLCNYLFFATLTYNNEHLPIVSTSSGYDISYTDITNLQLLFKRLRNNRSTIRPFRYFAVSERGSERGRPHAHLLLLIPKYETDDKFFPFQLESILRPIVLNYWSKNVGSCKKPIYEPLCTFKSKCINGKIFRNYDFHYVNPSLTTNGVSEVAYYVLKYMLKTSSRERRLQQALKLNLSYDEYLSIWNLVRSRCLISKGFGLSPDSSGLYSDVIINYLSDCISRTPLDSPFPMYFSPFVGNSFPLSPYYKSKSCIYPFSVAFDFAMRQKDDISYIDRPSESEYNLVLNQFKNISQKVDLNDNSDYLNLIYE